MKEGNKKIHLVMPMGGGGTRFADQGFHMPKPLIELKGKPFFYWAARSVEKFVDVEDIIFVVLKEHIEQFDIVRIIQSYYPDARIQVIPHVLNGAVLTCLEGMKQIDDDLPVLFEDCDHGFISSELYGFCEKAEFSDVDGALLTFESSNPAFSYVRFDANQNIVGTVEKEVVSNEAICGAYYFRNKELFSQSAETYLENCNYKEFFMSGVYNEMASTGKRLVTFHVDEHMTFGTPEEYEIALTDERIDLLV